MKKSTFVIFLFLSSLFFTCSEEDKITNPGNTEDFILPLKIGNWWQYGSERIQIDGITTIDNLDYFHYGNEALLSYKNGFLVAWDGEKSFPIIPKIPKLGDKWLWQGVGDTTRIIAEVSITVPAGTFQCFEVKQDNYHESWYWALNIGNVKGDGVELSDYKVEIP